MLFKHQPYDFEDLYRPIFELRIVLAWVIALIATIMISSAHSLSVGVTVIQSCVCVLMIVIYLLRSRKIYKMQMKLLGFKQEFISLEDFTRKTQKYVSENTVWLGRGFAWTPTQTQRYHEIIKHDYASIANHLHFKDLVKYHLKCAKKAWWGIDVYGNAIKALRDTYTQNDLDQIEALQASKRSRSKFANVWFGFKAGFTLIFPPKYRSKDMGCRWIHGLAEEETDIELPLDYFKGHCLILGTTGSGKTRLAELLLSQAIMRGETLIIIDPKGDKEMRENARKACDAYRKYCLSIGLPDPGNRFYSFHPAFPKQSVRLNLLANIARDTDVASRITNLTPSKEGGMDPFVAFGWLSINTIAQALLLLGENPSIESIKMNLLDGMQKLTSRAVEKFCTLCDKRRKSMAGSTPITEFGQYVDLYLLPAKAAGQLNLLERRFMWKTNTNPPDEAVAVIKCQVFHDHYEKEPQASTIASLVKLFQHPKEHFAKMINNMLPILEMLSTGTLSTMLSMSNDNAKGEEVAEQLSTMDIIKNHYVLYVGLDSLSDGVVGSAIGSLLLSDLTAAAGQIYNFSDGGIPPVNVFVDEAAECLNEPCIRLLNKGRGASFRMLIATQTISDFVSRLGSKDKAEMVLGNVNNSIALRTRDPISQKYLSEDLPETYIKQRSLSQGQNSLITNPMEHGSTQSEQLKETQVPLLPPQIFNQLPNCEYIANFAGGRVIKGRLPIIGVDYTKLRPKKAVESVPTHDESLDLDSGMHA
ncbi:MAG: conjugative transfer system coupling protein TraD [Succinatimonas hippei]|nr:conjugative transfer system coupling protein TraD [Succinatimonas hippei]